MSVRNLISSSGDSMSARRLSGSTPRRARHASRDQRIGEKARLFEPEML